MRNDAPEEWGFSPVHRAGGDAIPKVSASGAVRLTDTLMVPTLWRACYDRHPGEVVFAPGRTRIRVSGGPRRVDRAARVDSSHQGAFGRCVEFAE